MWVVSRLVLLVCGFLSATVDAGQQYCLCFVVLVLLLLLLSLTGLYHILCAIAEVAPSIQQDTQCVSSRLHLASKPANATPVPCMRPLSPCVCMPAGLVAPLTGTCGVLSHTEPAVFEQFCRPVLFWFVVWRQVAVFLDPGALLSCCVSLYSTQGRCGLSMCVCRLMQFCLTVGRGVCQVVPPELEVCVKFALRSRCSAAMPWVTRLCVLCFRGFQAGVEFVASVLVVRGSNRGQQMFDGL